MKHAWIMVMVGCWLAGCVARPTVVADPQLRPERSALPGSEGVLGWRTQMPFVQADGKLAWMPRPSMLAFEGVDSPPESGSHGCLRVTIPGPSLEGAWCQHYGAIAILTEPIPAGQAAIVTFQAKALAGAEWLSVDRTWGGTGRPSTVRLTSDWQAYRVTIVSKHPTQQVTFSLVAKDGGYQPAAPGAFLLGDLRVQKLEMAAGL